MLYTVRLSVDSYRKDSGFFDVYHAIVDVRAVSRRHALDKALTKAPETFRTVYYRDAFPDLWTLLPSAEIVADVVGGNA
jgi:hypothetical protein